MPLWLWNESLERAELRRQIREMKAQGLTGFFVGAGPGLQTPSLWEEWVTALRTAVEAAAEVGLEVHLYEDGPSGAASARVTRLHPALRGQYLKWQEWDLPAYLEAGEIGPGVQLREDQRGQIGAIVAMPYDSRGGGEEGPLDLEGAALITPFSTAETQGRLGGAEWRVFTFVVQTHAGIDLLNPVAGRKLIQLTYDRYAAEMGPYFGRTLLSLFLGGIGLLPRELLTDPLTLPWSPRLPQEFRRRCGLDLWPLLPALVADCGPRTEQVRRAFRETVAALFAESFYRPLAEWCAAHHLTLAGEVAGGEPLIRRWADAVSLSRHLQIPGAAQGEGKPEGWSLKWASSLAHQQHRQRVLSRCEGGPLAELREALDGQLAQGANLFVIAPPPSQSEQDPFWKRYRPLSEYTARLCYALTQGQPGARVAVLYPLRSGGIEGQLEGLPVEQDLFWVCQELARLHYEFDFLAEELLAEALIGDGSMVLGQARYELLVLPAVTALPRRTAGQIERFLHRGGRVLAVGRLSETGPDSEWAGRIAAWFGGERSLSAEGLWEGRGLPGKALFLQAPAPLARCQPRQAFAEALSQLLPPDLGLRSGGAEAEQVLFHHRVDRDRHLYWLVYTGAVPFTAELELPVEGIPELWDAATGEVRPVFPYSAREGRTTLSLPFRGQEGQLLVLRGPV